MECLSAHCHLLNREAAVIEEEPVASASASAAQQEEEYLEMDYALEIEDCSRYTFSTQPFYGSTSHTDYDDYDDCGARRGRWQEPEVKGKKEASSSDDFARVAVGMLFCEMRRWHLENLRRRSASAAAVETAVGEWREFARRLGRELKQFGHVYVRRKVSAMLLFESRGPALLVGDGSARAQELLENKMRLLRQLRERNQLFVHPATTSPAASPANASPALSVSHGSGAEAALTVITLPRLLSVVEVARLDTAGAEDEAAHNCGVVGFCNTSFPSITTSQKSGGGVSSSGSSNGSDEGGDSDVCFGSLTPSVESSCCLVNYA